MIKYKHEGITITLANKFRGRCSSLEDWEDLLQTTRMIINDLEETYNPKLGKFTTYCYTYVYRKLINHFEQASLRHHNEQIFCEYKDIIFSNRFICPVFRIDFIDNINILDNREKFIYNMKILGYYDREIGNELELSKQRVRQIYNKILEKIA